MLPADQLSLKALDLADVNLRHFKNTKCTSAEIATAIWAMELCQSKFLTDNDASSPKFVLYTDCQTVAGLLSRRLRLETRHFKSRKSGKLLSNAMLYKRFYDLCDAVKPEILWLKGHSKRSKDDRIREAFATVDQKTRNALRSHRLKPDT